MVSPSIRHSVPEEIRKRALSGFVERDLFFFIGLQSDGNDGLGFVGAVEQGILAALEDQNQVRVVGSGGKRLGPAMSIGRDPRPDSVKPVEGKRGAFRPFVSNE